MAAKYERIDKLGDLGEALFKQLCIKAGLAATKTGKDKFGWDYLVEFPIVRLPLVDFDAQPNPLKVFCQVKATDNFASLRVPISVSNWEKLAVTPMPSFVFVADFSKSDDANKLYLCHFDHARIGEALKRVRELNALGDHDIHKHEMLFVARSNEQIEQTGESLNGAFLRATGGLSMTEYTRKKGFLLDTIGYEKGRYLLEFNTTMSVDKISDALVGVGKIEILGGTVSSLRFGLAIEKEILQPGIVELEPAFHQTCEVRAASTKTVATALFQGSVFAPNVEGIDQASLKVRISSGSIVEILISKSTTSFRFSVSPEVEYRLSEVESALAFLNACHKGADIEFFSHGHILGRMELAEEIVLDASIIESGRRAKALRRFLDFVGIRDDVVLTIRDLFEPADSYHWINVALSSTGEITTGVESGKLSWRGTGIFATIIHLKINDNNLICFLYWDAQFVVKKQKVRGSISNVRCHSTCLINDGDIGELTSRFGSFQSYCQKIAKGTLLMRQLADESELRQTLKAD